MYGYQRKILRLLSEHMGFQLRAVDVNYTGANYAKGGTWDQVSEVSGASVALH